MTIRKNSVESDEGPNFFAAQMLARGMKVVETAKAEARSEGIQFVAWRMLTKKMPMDQISDLTGLSLDEVQVLEGKRLGTRDFEKAQEKNYQKESAGLSEIINHARAEGRVEGVNFIASQMDARGQSILEGTVVDQRMEGRSFVARRMLESGMPVEKVAELTDLPLGKVKAFQEGKD